MERWPLWRGGDCREVAIVEKRSLWRGGHCEEVAIIQRGGHCREVATVKRWPLQRGGHWGEVAVIERWMMQRGGRCGEVADEERWLLWRGGCQSMLKCTYIHTIVLFLSTHSNDGTGREQDKTVITCKSHTLCIFPSFIDPFPLIMILAVL